MMNRTSLLILIFTLGLMPNVQLANAIETERDTSRLTAKLRYQVETSEGSGRFHQLERIETFDLNATALIICDMWDSHHCYRAVQREKEFAPRLNEVITAARERGATIIHAPSGCMNAYETHPARVRAIDSPATSDYPADIASWCYQIPAEEAGKYPIDQSDGGEDDTPEEHAAWEEQLRREGRNVKAPWLRQIDEIRIDSSSDYITDQGKEVWNIIKDRNIKHVVLAGVHTNMCVLGRPFGLRRMALAGMNVTLLRDMTDTMYNPAAKPYVSHFSGTDLIIDHIERYVCPTMTSDQWIGGKPFRFAADTRPHVAMLISEPEYKTEVTLPAFAEQSLRRDHRISYVFGSETSPNELPGIEAVRDADLLVISVRRRTPPADQLQVVRDFVREGKPILGIRTASHAFCLRNQSPESPATDWPEFDAEVFGGNYSNHYGNELKVSVQPIESVLSHEILSGIDASTFTSPSSLYVVSPLAAKANVLMQGSVEGKTPEPVAWTFERADGGRSFYTSLGGDGDFENEAFTRMLMNAVRWLVPNAN